jgi:hypothetical protein
MWNNLTPQQQAYLMQMLMGGHPAFGGSGASPGVSQLAGLGIPGASPQLRQGGMQLSNPLMAGGNSAVNPQQQAQIMLYQQMLQNPQSWGASANGNIPMWQMLMGRSPMYGTGGAVP